MPAQHPKPCDVSTGTCSAKDDSLSTDGASVIDRFLPYLCWQLQRCEIVYGRTVIGSGQQKDLT